MPSQVWLFVHSAELCVLSESAMVDIAYVADPDLQADMQKAIDDCPDQGTQDECEAYGP